jgi:hypothetical protein
LRAKMRTSLSSRLAGSLVSAASQPPADRSIRSRTSTGSQCRNIDRS